MTGRGLGADQPLRPPSVPLVACNPFFSIWSPADKLTDVNTTHWTGKSQRLTSLVRIDGKTFRLMGAQPAELPALFQTSLQVLPTRTIYTFDGAGIKLTLTFLTAALPDDLDVLARPVTYLAWEAQSTDGKPHTVSVYFDASSEVAVNRPDQPVTFQNADVSGIKAWRVGSVEQPILKKHGDDVRIDWGYLYVAMAKDKRASSAVNTAQATRTSFIADGLLGKSAAGAAKQNTTSNDSVIAFAVNLGAVQTKPTSCWLMLAYDEIYSIQYMKQNLRPYWRRNGWDAGDLLKAAATDYPKLAARCQKFDAELMADVTAAGGENYAQICALAYRQCFAAGVFVADSNGQPLQFCKENHSGGFISTSDVFYPMSPQFLLFGPTLAKSFIVPFMNYAASDHWKFPFAPHDLGSYPQANGQHYGDGERGLNNQMPVEESGNLLCLFAAVAEMEDNAKFAGIYWKQLEQWAGYLKDKGFDPEKQLCTDDFAGHMAHNVNLSVKAICGLGSFAKLCELRGEQAKADEYYKLAREFAQRWVAEANDGDHYRLAFDKPGSWSQKYNLVWDRLLGLNLFPAEVARKEMDYYKKIQNEYGLPLDNRETYTKLDWITWTATLTQDRADFDALIAPIIRFLNATPNRSPMTDWYQTKTAKKVGFTARPVVGGVFMQMLYNKAVWQKYAGRDQVKAANWAPIPTPLQMDMIIPAADQRPATWNYTTAKPADGWMSQGFDDSLWKQGQSGFGTENTPGAIIGTKWNTGDIWLRREIEITGKQLKQMEFWFYHDEDAQVYINGVLALDAKGYNGVYDAIALSPAAKAALKVGRNLIAIHCHQTSGGQYVDLGFIRAPSQLQQASIDTPLHEPTPNTLTAQEQAEGWKLLWDGKTATGWRSPKSDVFPEKSWQIRDGVLSVVSSGNAESQAGGDIITRERYANFELIADFKTTLGCNSGIKIFVQPTIPPLHKATGQTTSGGSAIGMEFQILDDANHPDAKLGHNGDRRLGSLYDLIPAPTNKVVMPMGEWSHARILSQGQHVEFWLNGVKTVEFERGSPAFRAAVAASKFKDIPNFGEWPDGHILLQEHGSVVSYRNLKIRKLSSK